MAFADFERVQAVLDAKVGAEVQAFALAWTLPYRVECMSVTAAFALGFDPGAYCAEGCQTTRPSPYFNSASRAPFTDHRLRPAMLLAGSDVESAKRLIDRGLRSDERWPEGKAYLMNTSDAQPQRPRRELRAGEGGARVGVSDRAGRRRRARGPQRRDVRVHRRRPGRGDGHQPLRRRRDRRPPDLVRRRPRSGRRPDERARVAGGGRDRQLRHEQRAVQLPRASFPRSASSWRTTSPARRWSRRTGRACSCRGRASSSAIRWRGRSAAFASAAPPPAR